MYDRYVLSISFGKDSLAMLLRVLEEKLPLHEVVYYNTGMDFKCIDTIKNKVKQLLPVNVKFTEIHPQNPFLFDALYRKVKKRDGSIQKGNFWCGGVCRWATRQKINAINKITKTAYVYIGIAADEQHRLSREYKANALYPLVHTWNMTEADCLKYCRDKGYSWEEDGVDLYTGLSRVSCWCCRNKNLKELYFYYTSLPTYWNALKYLQNKMPNVPFYKNKLSIGDLERRFLQKPPGQIIKQTL